MNLWNAPSVSDKDIIGGLKEEQEVVERLGKKSETINFSPTVTLGLLTEVDCFKAIKELGDAKFFLKKTIAELALKGESARKEVLKATEAIQQVHNNQLIIVNDVCKRFGVIHPELENPTEEMLKTKTKYWDWYKEQHKKVYGSYPEIIEKKKPTIVG